MINFWVHLIDGSRTKLSHTVFKVLKVLHDTGKYQSKWIVKVKNILDSCGMYFLWNGYEECNPTWIKLSDENRLRDIDQQKWQSEVQTNRLCLNYRILKNKTSLEDYLMLMSREERIPLTKFRCGNHRLPISDNRFSDEPVPETCTLCTTGDIGDEFHYVLLCPSLNSERIKYVQQYYRTEPNTAKMSQLFNTYNILQLSNLAKFVNVIMSRFTQY